MSGWEGEAKRGRMQFHKRDTRKSHFSQCINLPRKGGEGRGKREGEEEIQSRVSERGVRKGAPVDRSLEKAPHSPAGSCSALVLLVQCWWSACPPPLPQNAPTHLLICAPQLPSMCWCYADSLDSRPQHMEARPRSLHSNVHHSWGSAGVGSWASCNHMFVSNYLHLRR